MKRIPSDEHDALGTSLNDALGLGIERDLPPPNHNHSTPADRPVLNSDACKKRLAHIRKRLLHAGTHASKAHTARAARPSQHAQHRTRSTHSMYTRARIHARTARIDVQHAQHSTQTTHTAVTLP